jgi:hypothetical protein
MARAGWRPSLRPNRHRDRMESGAGVLFVGEQLLVVPPSVTTEWLTQGLNITITGYQPSDESRPWMVTDIRRHKPQK